MIRHIKDQPPLEEGDGPIGLIMVPTRELATQIHHECKILAKVTGLHTACVYGGAGMAAQIADLKRGAEIVVCTPGRMIDVLSASNGKITNLRRVTFVVLDEADRMFDLGFEPQISKILSNIRPDKQIVMFSATFPRNVENLAKKILQKPIEIIVGSRGKICSNIEQHIEVIDEGSKFLRLLEILGEWYEKGSILIFVDKQVEADNLFKELLKYGYFPLVIHGGQDPTDREFTILDFKKGVRTLMVATSVCARGLDIASIVLVINYKCPNHKEDYIHRIGRTGRAGKKGTAITFISPEEEAYSLDIMAALKMSGIEPPEDLAKMAEKFKKKVEKGEAVHIKNKNLRGTGYAFDEKEQNKIKEAKRAMKTRFGIELDISDVELSDDEIVNKKEDKTEKEFDEKEILKMIKDPNTKAAVMQAATKAAKDAILAGASSEEVLAAAHNAIKSVLIHYKGSGIDQALRLRDEFESREEENSEYVSADLEINDYPQSARNRVTGKDFLARFHDLTNCTVSVRGTYIEPTKKVPPGMKKLTLHIVGESKQSVADAYRELRRTLDEAAMEAMSSTAGGKYTI